MSQLQPVGKLYMQSYKLFCGMKYCAFNI